MSHLQDEYAEILKTHLADPNEANLFQGYRFGKMCARKGISMSEVVRMHFAALKSGQVSHCDAELPDSQAFLLEATLAMSVSGGLKTMEHVLAALYDETIEQYRELRQLKTELEKYSQNLEEQVQMKFQELQTSEERFEVLVQTIPDIVYKIDAEGRFLYLNEAVRQLGYEPTELIGRHFSEIILPTEVELVCSSFVLPRYAGKKTGDKNAPKLFDERRGGARRTTGLEVRLLLKSGKTVPGMLEPLGQEVLVVEVNSSGLHAYNSRTKKKEFIGTVGVIRDITERKKYERELNKYHLQLEEMVEERTAELSAANQTLQAEIGERKRSEKFATGILEGMEEGLLVVAPDYRVVTANRAYARQVKKPLPEIVGQACHLISHQSPRPCHELGEICPVQQVLATGHSCRIAHQHLDQDGNPIQVAVSGYPMKDGNEITSVILIINDQTEQKRLEDQLRQAQKMEAIGTLAGGIAHDFNNILAAIIGYTQLACQDLPPEDATRLDLQESLKAAIRARELVEQILTFSRQTEQKKMPLLLAPVIKEGIKLLRASLPATVEIRQQIDEHLGPVAADPTQIHQVLVNLCTNAAQAIPGGSGLLEIGLQQIDVGSAEAARLPDLHPGPHARLTVRDNGIGMSDEILKRIFDPYFTTKEKGKGTGLGLAVVHGIIASHQGAVTVESAPGAGSAFHVYFPVIEKEVVEKQPPPTLPEVPTGKEAILLIEDEPALILMIQRLLTGLGYHVESCTDSEEAVELFAREPDRFDLVITDMTMPHMAGDAVATQILDLRPATPVILYTGYSEQMTEEKAAKIGIRRFAYKPLELSELARLVREALDEDRERN